MGLQLHLEKLKIQGTIARATLAWEKCSAFWKVAVNDNVAHLRGADAASSLTGRCLQGVRTHLKLAFAFSAALNLLYLAPSLFMMQVYDRVLPTSGVSTLVYLSLALLVALVCLAALDLLRARLIARASLRIDRLAIGSLLSAPTANASSGPVRDLDAVRQAATSPALLGAMDLPWTPIFLLACFLLHFWIGVLAILGGAAILAIALIAERQSREDLRLANNRSAAFHAARERDIQAHESLRALGMWRRIALRREQSRAVSADAQTHLALRSALHASGAKVARMGLQSIALAVGAFLAVKQELSPGAIIAASILTARAYAPLEQIVSGWRQLGAGVEAYKRLDALEAEAIAPAPRTPLPEPQGPIVAEHLSIKAPGSELVLLHDLKFELAPGKVVGVIGPSGAGKSTLARVLANAASPCAGALRWAGSRYADWPEAALAKYIGYLPQTTDLTDGTLAQNISRFETEDGTDLETVAARVIAAAKEAGAHDLIVRMPRGYDTPLSLGGGGISPGQAQRIALARALYNAPKLLVLDEPNAHLDSDGETALAQAVAKARERGAIIIIVAHRAGILNMTDILMVLNGGGVADFGPRAEVLARLQAKRAAVLKVGAP